MSTRHTGAVWLTSMSDPIAKLVMLCLAEHADFGTGECWPGTQRLSAMTGLDERTVRRKLRDLEAAGLVVTTLNQGRKGTNLYRLVVDGAAERPDLGSWGQIAPTRRGALCPHPPGSVPPEPVIEPDVTRALAQPLPEGWWPDADALAQARKDFPNVDLDLETHRFVDTNRAAGKGIARPASAWRAWLARGEQFAKRDAAAARPHPPGPARGGGRGADRTAAPGLRSRLRSRARPVDDGLAGQTIDHERRGDGDP